MAPGNHMPMRSHHAAPPPTHSQPLRQLSGDNANAPPMREQHYGEPPNVHSQYGGPVKPPGPGSMSRSAGNTQMHHPVPYRHHSNRMHGVSGPAHGEHYQQHHYHHHGYQHHNPGHRNSYPPAPYYQGMDSQQYHEAKYKHYQRPMYESPETVLDHSSMSRSPSPPPAPPSSQTKLSGPDDSARNAIASPPVGLAERRASGVGAKADSAQETAGNAQQSGPTANENSKPDPSGPKKNEDDDAASILLQLSGVPSQPDQEGDDATNEGRPMSAVHTVNRGPMASQSTAGLLKPIEASSSMDDDATIATVEGTDYAPDLTSEPSADSTDHAESDFPAPIPENYPTRLALKYDDTKLNSLHCFLRSELLEIFVVQKSSHKSPTHSPGSSVGRVGLRCVHCAMNKKKENRDEAPMAVFYPKSIAEIYRLVTSWQRCHLRKCRNLPPAVRAKWQSLRDSDKSRGKTHYWITSAKEIGLLDCRSRAGGIRFGPNTKGNEGAKDSTPAPSDPVPAEEVSSEREEEEKLEATTSSMPSEEPAAEIMDVHTAMKESGEVGA